MFRSAGLNKFYVGDEYIDIDVLKLELSRKHFKLGHRRNTAVCKLQMAAQMISSYSGMDEELSRAGYTAEKVMGWLEEARQ